MLLKFDLICLAFFLVAEMMDSSAGMTGSYL
jgi:hypothetical protein